MTLDLTALIKAVKPQAPELIVYVPAGDYPACVLRDLHPEQRVRIIAQGKVTFAGLQVSSCSNLSFEGIEVHGVDLKSASSPVLYLQSCTDVSFTGGRVSGSVDPVSGVLFGKGVSVADGVRVTVANCEIWNLFKGVSLANASDFALQSCDIHDVRTSPVDGGGNLQRVHIVDNHIHGIVPVARFGDHSDGIHLFTKNSLQPCDGIVISGNRMEMSSAPGTLGINLEGTPQPGGFTNIKVTGNKLFWNNNQGITTNHVRSGEFTANELYPAPGLDNPSHAPGFVFRDNGPAVTVTGNTSKDGKSMKPYRANTFLTPAQIAAYGSA